MIRIYIYIYKKIDKSSSIPHSQTGAKTTLLSKVSVPYRPLMY